MASPIRTSHALSVTLELLVLAGLVIVAMIGLAASVMLGPAIIVLVLVVAVLALGVEQIERRGEAQEAAKRASAAGIAGPIPVWGKVVDVAGECPSGNTPQKGQSFVVAGGRIWPELCVHAEQAVLREVARMETDPKVPDEPVRYHDRDHEVDMELYRAPAHLKAA